MVSLLCYIYLFDKLIKLWFLLFVLDVGGDLGFVLFDFWFFE